MLKRTRPDWRFSENYAARGITVCDRWIKSFDNFYADMGPRPEGMTLDRLDNDKGYEPSNCRWATLSQQNGNRRTTMMLTVDGETLSCAEWSRRTGVPLKRIWTRVKAGWSPEDAVKSQPRTGPRRGGDMRTPQEAALADAQRRFGDSAYTVDHGDHKEVGVMWDGKRTCVTAATWENALEKLERKLGR